MKKNPSLIFKTFNNVSKWYVVMHYDPAILNYLLSLGCKCFTCYCSNIISHVTSHKNSFTSSKLLLDYVLVTITFYPITLRILLCLHGFVKPLLWVCILPVSPARAWCFSEQLGLSVQYWLLTQALCVDNGALKTVKLFCPSPPSPVSLRCLADEGLRCYKVPRAVCRPSW